MPVGQLLGIEEPAAPKEQPAPEPVEVQQLAERIAGEYLRQQPRPRRWVRWASLALVIGLALGLWQTSGRLSDLEENYRNLQFTLSDLRSSVNQLSGLPSSLQQLLAEQASLTLNQSAEILSIDPAAGTVTFALSAQPKEYRPDYTARFYSLDEQGQRTEVLADYDGTRVTAQLTAPLTQSCEVYLTLCAPDGTESSQLVDWFPSLWGSSACLPYVDDTGLLFTDCTSGTPFRFTRQEPAICSVPDRPELADLLTQEVHAVSVRAELWQDGKKLADCPPLSGDPANWGPPRLETASQYAFQLPEIPVTMEADSWIGVVFLVTDNLGRISTSGEFFTIQDDMLLFIPEGSEAIWEEIDAAMGLR